MLGKEEIALIALDTIKDSAFAIFNHTNTLEYQNACREIDASELSESQKKLMKGTHYVLLLVKTEMLKNPDHDCSVAINSDGIVLGETKVGKLFDLDLLRQLCDENDVNISEEPGADSLNLKFSLREKNKTR